MSGFEGTILKIISIVIGTEAVLFSISLYGNHLMVLIDYELFGIEAKNCLVHEISKS